MKDDQKRIGEIESQFTDAFDIMMDYEGRVRSGNIAPREFENTKVGLKIAIRRATVAFDDEWFESAYDAYKKRVAADAHENA